MRKKYYLTLDTETATLPFVNEICKNASEKKKISIAKPLIYDIAWIISDRQGNIIKKKNYLVEEIFNVKKIFETAYYRKKINIYKKLLEESKVEIRMWEEIVQELMADLESCDIAVAYNACFDFKKAIPFTDRYMEALYSPLFDLYMTKEKERCKKIILDKNENKNDDYLKPFLEIRDKKFPIADLWGLTCHRLINIDKYRNYCLEHNLLTDGGLYFKTSAETSFQYLNKKYDFIESHTALDDSDIETKILEKILKKGKIEPEIKSFPFRELGTTYEYVSRKEKYKEVVKQKIEKVVENSEGKYKTRLNNILLKLEGGWDMSDSKTKNEKLDLEILEIIIEILENEKKSLTAKEISENEKISKFEISSKKVAKLIKKTEKIEKITEKNKSYYNIKMPN